ncbi:HAMP domain-containing sensor histidine kinase [Streptomyces sp. 35G-GA-8]|uniref:sensor histidine kinase n=1 Tax=Streptomyces sp. 35G-GA-8 TaxID=2939434 RepID=UPI00201E9AF2|nr:ATP-binding protein [Streptomyces sp. 35G-GA-8]MCL7379813.1 ATP-binding protein [Streptomyces sp. 35G-GA-8]
MPATASEPAGRVRIRWSARLRLTLLYGALFFVSGACLLAVTYLLVVQSPASKGTKVTTTNASRDTETQEITAEISYVADRERQQAQRTLLTRSGIALGVMTGLSGGLGWLVAGRVLRPVRVMTDRARRISAHNLHERLAMPGPADDELKNLGDTFDELLARLDTAFDAQRRFVANASHELRTPLTLQRTVIEVALNTPDPDVRTLRAVCERALAIGEDQERLIEALLTLASSQSEVFRTEPLDLADIVTGVLDDLAPTRPDNVTLDSSLAPAPTEGSTPLLERLVTNLLSNAQRYTPDGGWIRVTTASRSGTPTVRVVNSGPVIPREAIGSLYQPFQRLGHRSARADGHGLGLSIVAAIADAHHARIATTQGPEGGLDITIAFPQEGTRERP